MPSVRIVTKDRYLYQKIFLLLDGSYEITSEGSADFTLVDVDTTPVLSGARVITLSRGDDGELKIPFSPKSLLSLLSGEEQESRLLTLEGKCARLSGRIIKLTEVEAALLACLLRSGGETVSKERLLSEVWGEGTDGGVVNVYVHYLREKLEAGGEKIIFSTRGVGYRISKKFISKGDGENA
jgi:hypothetical protein